jgi:general secretion pathway protein D
MRRAGFILSFPSFVPISLGAGALALVMTLPAFSTDQPDTAPIVSCGNGIPGGTNCVVTKQEMKEAREEFVRGVKLQDQKRLEEAFTAFDDASRKVPQNVQFLAARELVKAQLVFNHVERGNALMREDSPVLAAGEFRAALDLDPDNVFAEERLQEATRKPKLKSSTAGPMDQFASEIHVEPKKDQASFHFRGDTRGLYNELASAYGLTVQFDDSVQTKQVRFTMENVDFFTALKLAGEVSKTMWAPLGPHQLFIAADNPENHKQFDHMSLETFVLPPHSTPQEANDFTTTLRNIFDLRFITTGQTEGTVEIRAPEHTLNACGKLLAQLSNERPQVMLNVKVLEIDHQLTRAIGVHVPQTFNLYNIPAVALAGIAGLGGQNIQQLINQLISSGGINQAGSSALSGLLSQLQGQGNGVFSQPLATFGGGLTFMGVSLDHLTTTLSLNESWVRGLEDMNVRASQNNDTTFHVGERYPIMNASYAPIYNSPQISQVLGNQSYQAPFPSVSYEDLGLNLKAKPTIHGDDSVSLQLDLEVRSLTGESNDGIPVISNKEYKGSITLKNGEPAVVAGEVSRSDMFSIAGVPGFGMLLATNTKTTDDDELMIVITPQIVADVAPQTPEIWLSEK